MKKSELVSKVVEQLRTDGYRKSVSIPKRRFTITDSDGQRADFKVGAMNRETLITIDDVSAVFDSIMDNIVEAISEGESVYLGRLGRVKPVIASPAHVNLIQAGQILKKKITIPARFVCKFIPSESAKTAMRLYTMTPEAEHIIAKWEDDHDIPEEKRRANVQEAQRLMFAAERYDNYEDGDEVEEEEID